MDCDKSPLMHKHHIIPRYMGGTDDKNNLVEVSITQHAMFHYCNYRLCGNDEDKFAWLGLSGQICKEDIISSMRTTWINLARTPEAIEKKKNTFKEIHHQQGEKNSQYGKMWITNGTKDGTYRINKGEPIPKGYKPGRVSLKEENSKYVYVITTPDEKTIKTTLLYRFCKDNELCYECALRVSKGQRKHHKGYKVFRQEINILDTIPEMV
jgi:hypothetical protein